VDDIKTRITSTTRSICKSAIGPENIFPQFKPLLEAAPIVYAEDLPREVLANRIENATQPPLPYRLQDQYDRGQEHGPIEVISMENAYLRASFYPGLGGRLISLVDKADDRELLFDNPVLRFANLGIRGAWFSGGIEWNPGIFGHSPQSCAPVYVATVSVRDGQLLRMYEFDRKLQSIWQVDVYLPDHSRQLWVHVRIRNPNDHPIPYYWWTNIAVPQRARTRVLARVHKAVSHGMDHSVVNVDYPYVRGEDISYPTNLEGAASLFFLREISERPWIASVDADGRGILHCSTQALCGRKYWAYGSRQGSKNWMDFLSLPGKGDYIEIQAGITPTQTQTRPIAARDSLEWTECLMPLRLDPAHAHHDNYQVACDAAAAFMHAQISEESLKATHQFLSTHTEDPIESFLHHGTGWGHLHEKLTGSRIPGLVFEADTLEEERPWYELLNTGQFLSGTLAQDPESWCVSAEWRAAIGKSMTSNGATWLHHLHLGVMEFENEVLGAAVEHFSKSVALKENVHAYRNLALVYRLQGQWHLAAANYQKAWRLSPCVELAVEIAQFYQQRDHLEATRDFISALPHRYRSHERIQLVAAALALEDGEGQRVREILLKQDFRTIREGETVLTDLWFASHVTAAQKRLRRELAIDEAQRIRRQNPPPARLDFRLD
jgi:tetratricopeptide (TPR) repeat protein